MKDERWDAGNKPQGIILGASPGFAQFGAGEEKLIYQGLARKISRATRMGFEFAMIDYEALSEMFEAEVKERIEQVKRVQKIEVGLHAPTNIDLCIANAYEWKRMHEYLQKSAFSAREIVKAKFYLFHTSSKIRPHVSFKYGHQEPRVQQVSHDGINLGAFMKMVDNGTYEDPKRGYRPPKGGLKDPNTGNKINLVDWFMARFIGVLFNAMGTAGDPGMITHFDEHMIIGDGTGYDSGVRDAMKKNAKFREDAWRELKKQKINELNRTIGSLRDQIQLNQAAQQQINIKIQMQGGVHPAQQARLTELTREANSLESDLRTHANMLDAVIKADSIETLSELNRNFQLYDLENQLHKIINEGRNPKVEIMPKYKTYTQIAKVKDYTEHYNFPKVYDYWMRKGSEGEEQVSYRVMAKYMYLTGDPLWKELVGTKYDPDIIIDCADRDIKYYDYRFLQDHMLALRKGRSPPKQNGEKTKEDKLIDTLIKKMITAVACKYIEGHLFVKDPMWSMKALPMARKTHNEETGEEMEDISVYDFTKQGKIQIFIETAMPPQGEEGELRIMSASDHIKLVKNLDDGKFTSYCIDFEHLTVNFINPTDDIATLKEGDGGYVNIIHINAPRPMTGAHAPIEPMSHDMYIIYKWLWELKQKGMKSAYWIWEMGSYGVKESGITLRKLRKYLLKGVRPDKLPMEFYGLDRKLLASQQSAIREHWYEPLRGLLVYSEEEHGVLGKTAVDKGKAVEWRKGRYR